MGVNPAKRITDGGKVFFFLLEKKKRRLSFVLYMSPDSS